jgi:hypothetical protein
VSDDFTRKVEDIINNAIDSAEMDAVAKPLETARVVAREHGVKAAAALTSGCEICGKPACTVVTRRIHHYDGGFCSTSPDPTAPLHPRCGDHANADAYVIDGVPPNCGRKSRGGKP